MPWRCTPGTSCAPDLNPPRSAAASGGASSAADGDHAGAPGAARRLDLDLVTGLGAEQRPAHGRVGRDTADARDLDLQAPALLVLELDLRADSDRALGRRVLVDEHGAREAVAQHPDPPLEQSLLVLGGVILEVLGEVAEAARGLDRLDD